MKPTTSEGAQCMIEVEDEEGGRRRSLCGRTGAREGGREERRQREGGREG